MTDNWDRPPTMTDDAVLGALLDLGIHPVERLRKRLAGAPGVELATDDDLRAAAELVNRVVRTMLCGNDADWDGIRRARKALDARERAARARERTMKLVLISWLFVLDATPLKDSRELEDRARQAILDVQLIIGQRPSVAPGNLLIAAGKRDRGDRRRRGRAAAPALIVMKVYAVLSDGLENCWPPDEMNRSLRGRLGALIKREGARFLAP